jgi:hypothetical protein
MKITDEKIKRTVTALSRKRPRGSCPDDATLAALVEGRLTEADADRMLGHLARCSSCLAVVAVLRELDPAQEADCRVPFSALERARKLDPAAKGVIEVVINFASGLAEVIRASGNVVNGFKHASESLRGESHAVSDTLITFSKEFPPYLAEVDVEKTKPDRGEITVKLIEEGQPARGLRVSIFDRDLELESAMLESGVAVFENLKFGEYHLEITRVGEPIGRITLEMKGDGK